MFNAKQKLFALLHDMRERDPLAFHTKALGYGFGIFLLLAWSYVLFKAGLFYSLLLGACFVIALYLQINRYAARLIKSFSTQKPKIEDARLLIVSAKSMTMFSSGVLIAYITLLLSAV
ncbi:hypothetical protein BGC07_15905 [Piscirickettsia litoralis]|uniref:DUF202 domain-containing protein n=2 Tax=Piscirickettsia litoralis TaxID=1891921 RepID=A0ABX2ZYF6_9GAMM|nr:hypothetical protein BGC07_15905 [Piscirickettsia litoralis]